MLLIAIERRYLGR